MKLDLDSFEITGLLLISASCGHQCKKLLNMSCGFSWESESQNKGPPASLICPKETYSGSSWSNRREMEHLLFDLDWTKWSVVCKKHYLWSYQLRPDYCMAVCYIRDKTRSHSWSFWVYAVWLFSRLHLDDRLLNVKLLFPCSFHTRQVWINKTTVGVALWFYFYDCNTKCCQDKM